MALLVALAGSLASPAAPPPAAAATSWLSVSSRSHTVPAGGTVTITLSGIDEGGSPFTFEIVTPPGHGTLGAIPEPDCRALIGTTPQPVDCSAPVIYTPEDGYLGPDGFSYQAIGGGTSPQASVAIEVAEVDAPPVGNPDPGIVEVEDVPISLLGQLLGNDTDPEGDSLTVRLLTQPEHGTIDLRPDGLLTYTSDPDYATLDDPPDPFTYAVSDGVTEVGPIEASTWVIWVDDPPSFTAGGGVTVAEDAGSVTVPDWATDVRSGPANEESWEQVHFDVTVDQPSLFVAGPIVDTVVHPGPGASADLTFTPAPNAWGTANVTIQANDLDPGGGSLPPDVPHQWLSDPVTIQITVTPVDDAPTITIAPATETAALEDQVATILPDGVLSIGDVDTDSIWGPGVPPDDAVDVTVSVAHGRLSLTSPALATLVDGDGIDDASMTLREHPWAATNDLVGLGYLPDPDFYGSDTLTVHVDDRGIYGAGGPLTVDAELPIQVDPVDDPPTFQIAGDVSAPASGGRQTFAGWASSSPGPANEAAQTVSYLVDSVSDASLFSVQPAVADDGTLTFTPAGTAGVATVTLHAHDDGGGGAWDQDTSATQSFEIDLVDGPPVDGPLVADPQSVSTAEDTPVPITLTGSGPAGVDLVYRVTTAPGHGLLGGSAPDLTYSPAGEYSGPDSFTFTVGDGTSEAADATVSITVTAVDDPVMAADDAAQVVATTTSTLDVLANDSAGPGEPMSDVTITAVSPPARGSASITADRRAIRYDPAGCATGPDQFVYTITDGGSSDTAMVSVDIARPGEAGLARRPITNTPAVGFVTGSTMGARVPLRVRWCAVTASGTAVRSYRVRQSSDGGSSYTTMLASTARRSTTLSVARGIRYRWKVRAVDTAGRAGSYRGSAIARVGRIQDSSARMTYAGGWHLASRSGPSGGTERYTRSAGATATLAVGDVAAFAIVGPRSPHRGRFRVYVDDHLVATVREARSGTGTRYRQVLYAGALGTSASGHTIRLVAVGDGRVDLDAILTLARD